MTYLPRFPFPIAFAGIFFIGITFPGIGIGPLFGIFIGILPFISVPSKKFPQKFPHFYS